MVPAELFPSPQLIVAENAPAGSRPLACVKVAVVSWEMFFWVAVVGLPEMTMGASATGVVAELQLFAEFGSAELALTEAESVSEPSSVAWAVTVTVTAVPGARVPRLKVTTPPDWEKD